MTIRLILGTVLFLFGLITSYGFYDKIIARYKLTAKMIGVYTMFFFVLSLMASFLAKNIITVPQHGYLPPWIYEYLAFFVGTLIGTGIVLYRYLSHPNPPRP